VSAIFRERYNIAVPSNPQPQPRPATNRQRVEAAGGLSLAALVLIFIVFRYGHHIAWSARCRGF
jgi:hypothetical protein